MEEAGGRGHASRYEVWRGEGCLGEGGDRVLMADFLDFCPISSLTGAESKQRSILYIVFLTSK